ncbi:MAG: hypothetical protein K2N69_03350 [Helicobacter sp.]|nr:hypothetical protein [Helicobacter sp.]
MAHRILFRIPLSVITNVSETINEQRISKRIPTLSLATLAPLARNDTWNLVMLRRSRNNPFGFLCFEILQPQAASE